MVDCWKWMLSYVLSLQRPGKLHQKDKREGTRCSSQLLPLRSKCAVQGKHHASAAQDEFSGVYP